MNVFDAIAAVGWALLVLGWLSHRDRRRHLSFVIPGMALDLGLVLWLEVTRHVIELTVEKSYGALEVVHIAASAGAVLLYLPTIALGVRLVLRKGGPAARVWHRRCATTALALRTVGFAFMWWV